MLMLVGTVWTDAITRNKGGSRFIGLLLVPLESINTPLKNLLQLEFSRTQIAMPFLFNLRKCHYNP